MSLRVLLADDSMTAQNMGKKILAEAGYDVVAVSNGAAAVKKLADFRPDIVVADVYMPGYTGLEVCERIKNAVDTSRIPVLLSVGKLEPFRPEEGIKVRADGVIIKPFEATDLLAVMEKLAERVSSATAAAMVAPPAPAPSVPAAPELMDEFQTEPVQNAAPAYDIPAEAPAFGLEEIHDSTGSPAEGFPDYVREFGLSSDSAVETQLEPQPSPALIDDYVAAPATNESEEKPAAAEDDFEARLAAAMAAYEEPEPSFEPLPATLDETPLPETAPAAELTAAEIDDTAATAEAWAAASEEPVEIPEAAALDASLTLPEEQAAPLQDLQDLETEPITEGSVPPVEETFVEAASAPAWIAEEAPIDEGESLSLEDELAAFSSADEKKPETALREPVGKTTFDSELSDIMEEATAKFWAAAPPAIDEAPLQIDNAEPEPFALAPEIEIEAPAPVETDVLAETVPAELAPAYEPISLKPEVSPLADLTEAEIPSFEIPPASDEPVVAPVMATDVDATRAASGDTHDDEFTFGGEGFASLQMLEEPMPAVVPSYTSAVDEDALLASPADAEQQQVHEEAPGILPATEAQEHRPSYLDEFEASEPAAVAPAFVTDAAAPADSAAAGKISAIDESIIAEIVYRVLDDLKPAIVAEITSQLNERLARGK